MVKDSRLRQLADVIYGSIFPPKCPFCGNITSREEFSRGICLRCCDLGYVHLISRDLQGQIHQSLKYNTALYCAAKYTGSMKEAMIRYKFGGENWLCRPFASLLYKAADEAGCFQKGEIISYIPISKKRMATRGYDQSKLIACKLAKYSSLECINFLFRDNAQSSFTSGKNLAERRAAQGRFSFDKRCVGLIRGRGVILVDDILTTGSTLNECSRLLLDYGALYVKACVVTSGRRDI